MKSISVWLCAALLMVANIQLCLMQRAWKSAQPLTVGEMQRMIAAGRGYDEAAERIPYVEVLSGVEATIDARHPIDVRIVK